MRFPTILNSGAGNLQDGSALTVRVSAGVPVWRLYLA